jgi:hypothetical protein
MGDVMRDPARHIAVIKGAQARITTAFMLREIHALIYRYYPQGSIYYFPDKVAVEGFSKTRFSPLVRDNACIKKHLKRTDSVSIKQVGKAMLSLLGCKATANIQGKKDSNAVRSTPADSIIRDERDLFDDEMAEMSEDRMLNSKLQRIVDLGTPTIPDFGIDKLFGESDQKHWMIPCESCNEYTCIADEFPNSIRYKKDERGKYRPYFGCIKCGKEIYVVNGKFIPKFPEKYDPKYPMEGISGYHISHFITPNCNLNIVMQKYEAAQMDKSLMGLFNNKYLGHAYIPVEDRLLQQDVFNCCGNDNMKTQSSTVTAMAADIMKTNRVVIAQKTGKEAAKIIYMARISGFDALFDLVQQFNVKSAVVCLRPYEESFRKFQARCKQYDPEIKVFGSEYRDKQQVMSKVNEETGTYVLSRTEIMDKSQSWVRSGKLEIPRKCEEVNIFAKEVCNTAKTLEVNTDTGDRVYRYRPVGDKQEHYRHCLNYLWMAILNVNDYAQLQHTGYDRDEQEYNPMRYGL